MKQIERIYPPQQPHMVGDGFRVHNFIPTLPGLSMNRLDPFIMLDYASPYEFQPTQKPKGVGVHPHRGFSTVTIAYQGEISHHDSAGNSGTIKQGGVQWMKAASGVLHTEYHSEEFSRKGGMMQMVQLWVNLPKANKMDKPAYFDLQKEDLNRFPFEGGELELIAGEINGNKGPVSTDLPVTLANILIHPKQEFTFSKPAQDTNAILVIQGEGVIQGQSVQENQLVLFSNQGEEIKIESSNRDLKVLVLSGKPLREPIASHGPFVMNSQQEIVEAFEDFEKGKFGVL